MSQRSRASSIKRASSKKTKTKKKTKNIDPKITTPHVPLFRSIRIRSRSVEDDANEEMDSNSSLEDLTTSELYRRITVMSAINNNRRKYNDDVIAEYLWRLGDNRSMFEQHFDLESFQVLEQSPIAAQLTAYTPRLPQTAQDRWLNQDLRLKWIATWLTVRFNLPPESRVHQARPDYAALFGNLRLFRLLPVVVYVFTETTTMAAAGGHLNCLKYATEQGVFRGDETTSFAALYGHLDCLKYAVENDYVKHGDTSRHAVEGGHLNCLKYATEQHFAKHPQTISTAAKKGDLNCLKYATENGFHKSKRTTTDAAEGGNFECLKYVTEKGFHKHKDTTMVAADRGYIDCLQYATEHGFNKHGMTASVAAQNGHLNCLKYATENGFQKHEDTTLVAATGGHLDCLKYATENGFPKHEATTVLAAKGYLDCLKYATENGFQKHENTTVVAAESGHLDCLKYATENGFPKHEETTLDAAKRGHLDCLKYATENGFQKHEDTTLVAAGYLDCLRYAAENDFRKHPETTLQAARSGNLACLQYATEHGFFKHPDTRRAIRRIIDRMHINHSIYWECLKYAREHGFPAEGDEIDEQEEEDEIDYHTIPHLHQWRQRLWRARSVPSVPRLFAFPPEWNHVPLSRIENVDIEIPLDGASGTEVNTILRHEFNQRFGETCYSAWEADNVSMYDFLDQNKGNHVVTLGPHTMANAAGRGRLLLPAEAMMRDQLESQMLDRSAQYYPCVGPNGSYPVDISVSFIKLPLSYNPYVPASDLTALLSATHSTKQVWELTDSGLDVATMASGTAVHNQNHVSAHHCQSGTGRRIYRLSAVEIATFYVPPKSVDVSSTSSSRRRPRLSSNNNNNTKRSTKKGKKGKN